MSCHVHSSIMSPTTDFLISRVWLHYQSFLHCTVGWVVLHGHNNAGFRRRNTYSRKMSQRCSTSWTAMQNRYALKYSVCLPVDAFPFLTFHAISEEATTTDPTTRTMTTTTPTIAPDTCVEGSPPTFAGGNWDDRSTLLLSVVDDSPAAGRQEDASLLYETCVASATNVTATEILGESGAADVIDGTELLVIFGTFT